MIAETIIALRYSIRPWPSGCSLSGALPASFVPIMVITELSASERLFTPSRTTAMEFAIRPAVILKAERNTFVRMPVILVLTMICSRSAALVSIQNPFLNLIMTSPVFSCVCAFHLLFPVFLPAVLPSGLPWHPPHQLHLPLSPRLRRFPPVLSRLLPRPAWPSGV